MGSDLQLQYIKGIGPKRAEALLADGIVTFQDLLYYIPRTYVSHLRATTLASLAITLKREGNFFASGFDFKNDIRQEVTVLGRIISQKEHTFGNRRKLLVLELADASSGRAYIKFWNYIDYYKKVFPVGTYLSVSGQAEIDSYNKVNFNHPLLEKLDDDDERDYNSGQILPIYPIKDNMRKAGINTRMLRKMISNLLDKELDSVHENLPPGIVKSLNLMHLTEALKNIHFPGTFELSDAALKRLKFNEIFYFEIMLARRNKGLNEKGEGIFIRAQSILARKLYDNLAFELTSDQKKVIREIMADMGSGKPMNRLLQGDVGSGKTIVSLLTMLAVIDSGYQVAIMAPTELLAEQHYLSVKKFTSGLGVNITQLVGRQNKRYRKEISDDISSGRTNIVVGTHAMFESSIVYNNLGFIVIDEQHRFGVNQRADLVERAKESLADGVHPHILVMSATPIPRTLSMTLYGDLNASVIREMPKNRKAIITKIAFDKQIDDVFDFVKQKVAEGSQAYIVYPLVEKSEKIEYKSAVEHFEKLSQTVFRGLKCGLLHGQLFGYEKDEIMSDFQKGQYQILIATTVIEVGIDVPNACVMVIEDAERFGLSQLHQLRGRVGRGSNQSYCILVTKDKFNFELKRMDNDDMEKKAVIIRLKTMERTSDGFEISEVDLKLRGPGDMMGTKQSGLPEFKFLDLTSDADIISQARNKAFEIINQDPNLLNYENRIIRFNYNKYQYKDNFYDIA